MSSLNKITIISLFLCLNIGCNKELDGEVYLRVRAILTPLEFSIDNSDLPDAFQESDYDLFYKTKEGSYPFSYVDHNETLHPQPGEFGVLDIVFDPDLGEDLYIDLILLSQGAVIENNDYFTVASTLNYNE
tara:strand:+ start:289 stop:681 length:393 start_codon:yes stop_codon:yes gene_type:complete